MFSEKTDKLDPSKLLIVGMDGPNVNWNFYDILVRKRIGRDGEHWKLQPSFKTGAKKTLENFKNNDGTFYNVA